VVKRNDQLVARHYFSAKMTVRRAVAKILFAAGRWFRFCIPRGLRQELVHQLLKWIPRASTRWIPASAKQKLVRELLPSISFASTPELLKAFVARVRNECPPETVLALRKELEVTIPLDYAYAQILLVMGEPSEFPRQFASRKEPWTIEWISRVAKDGAVLYDLGANVGAYSLVAARQSASVRVVAFEPSFENYAALCRNIARNHCESQVIALPVAVGRSTGIDTFNYYALGAGKALHTLGNSLDALGQPFEPEFRQRMISVNLDDAVAVFGLPNPNHIKIDVDGTEMDVLAGGDRVIRSSSLKSMLVEINEQRVPAQQIVSFLADRGLALVTRYDRPNPLEVSYLLFERP
jgi:FkbM family methyltransferase